MLEIVLGIMLFLCGVGLVGCAYMSCRNEKVSEFRSWFIDKCHDWFLEDAKHREYPVIDEIIGTYDYLFHSYRRFEKMIIDKQKYIEIIGKEKK